MSHSAASSDGMDTFNLSGSNIIEGFRELGYHTIGTGAVAWFDQQTATGWCLPLLLINFGTAVRLGTFVRNFHGWISKYKSKSQNDLYLCFSMWVKLMFLIGMKMPIGKDGQVHVSLLEVVNARITKVEGVKLHASSGLMHSLVLY